MTSKPPGRACGVRTVVGIFLACLIFLPVSAAAQGARGPDKAVNVVKDLRARDATVEIELHSTTEFPVRDEVVVLRIGKRDFFNSRSPEGGSLNTLIFVIPVDAFAGLADGDPMTVRFGKRDPEEIGAADMRWNFGKLNKGLLRQ